MRNIEDEILRKKLHDCGHFMCTYHNLPSTTLFRKRKVYA